MGLIKEENGYGSSSYQYLQPVNEWTCIELKGH